MHIVIDNNQLLQGLTEDERIKVKYLLTFDNPKYKQAKKYGRSRYISIPPYLEYYKQYKNGDMEVPLGFNVLQALKPNKFTYETLYKRVDVSFPPIKISLREDQSKAFYAFHSFIRPYSNGYNNMGIIQLPTGKGKTILGLYMSQEFKQKTLILVHKDDLVVGWQNDIRLCFGDNIDIGLIKAKSRKVGEQFTIATVQTLSKMSEEELSKYTHSFGMVILDECLTGDTLVVKSDGSVTEIPYIYNNCNITLYNT